MQYVKFYVNNNLKSMRLFCRVAAYLNPSLDWTASNLAAFFKCRSAARQFNRYNQRGTIKHVLSKMWL